MLNSSTIFEINEEEFLLTLLDSGEIGSRIFSILEILMDAIGDLVIVAQ